MRVIEIERMEQILVDILGEPKSRGMGDIEAQLQFNCPRCREENNDIPDGKYNLEVTFSKNLKHGGVFQCWRCSSYDEDMKGSIYKLLRQYGTSEQYREYKSLVETIFESRLYDYYLENGVSDDDSLKNDSVFLPKSYKKINLSDCDNDELLGYLKKRRITQGTIDRFSIGYTSDRDEDWTMRNRIIIPSYNAFDELNYFIGRDFTGRNKIKYKNCTVDKKDIIFQESLINWDNTVYLCEGVFDAIRFPVNGISMLGKVLTRDMVLYDTLINKANAGVVIVLDGDTNEMETKRIYKLLDYGRLRGKVKYIDLYNGISKYKDMGEIYEKEGERGVVEVLKQAKKFNEIELIY